MRGGVSPGGRTGRLMQFVFSEQHHTSMALLTNGSTKSLKGFFFSSSFCRKTQMILEYIFKTPTAVETATSE